MLQAGIRLGRLHVPHPVQDPVRTLRKMNIGRDRSSCRNNNRWHKNERDGEITAGIKGSRWIDKIGSTGNNSIAMLFLEYFFDLMCA